jgi:hypothetical protein
LRFHQFFIIVALSVSDSYSPPPLEGVDKCALLSISSFRRRPESNIFKHSWTSRIAGGDDLRNFFDTLL